MEMARVDFFAARNLLPNSGNSDPANHPQYKARPAQSPFFYEPSATFKRKLKVEREFKIGSGSSAAQLKKKIELGR